MIHDVSIVTACADDLPLLAAISRETFADTFSPFNTEDDMKAYAGKYFTEKALLEEMNSTGQQFLLAKAEQELIGYALIREDTSAEMQPGFAMELARLYVRSSFIGKGVGKQLLEYISKKSAAAGKQWLWLGVWEFNLPAIRFYQSFGFNKFSEHDFVLGKDVQRDWLMRKEP